MSTSGDVIAIGLVLIPLDNFIVTSSKSVEWKSVNVRYNLNYKDGSSDNNENTIVLSPIVGNTLTEADLSTYITKTAVPIVNKVVELTGVNYSITTEKIQMTNLKVYLVIIYPATLGQKVLIGLNDIDADRVRKTTVLVDGKDIFNDKETAIGRRHYVHQNEVDMTKVIDNLKSTIRKIQEINMVNINVESFKLISSSLSDFDKIVLTTTENALSKMTTTSNVSERDLEVLMERNNIEERNEDAIKSYDKNYKPEIKSKLTILRDKNDKSEKEVNDKIDNMKMKNEKFEMKDSKKGKVNDLAEQLEEVTSMKDLKINKTDSREMRNKKKRRYIDINKFRK